RGGELLSDSALECPPRLNARCAPNGGTTVRYRLPLRWCVRAHARPAVGTSRPRGARAWGNRPYPGSVPNLSPMAVTETPGTQASGTQKRERWTAHWAHLYDEVVTSGLCTGCAGCVVA